MFSRSKKICLKLLIADPAIPVTQIAERHNIFRTTSYKMAAHSNVAIDSNQLDVSVIMPREDV